MSPAPLSETSKGRRARRARRAHSDTERRFRSQDMLKKKVKFRLNKRPKAHWPQVSCCVKRQTIRLFLHTSHLHPLLPIVKNNRRLSSLRDLFHTWLLLACVVGAVSTTYCSFRHHLLEQFPFAVELQTAINSIWAFCANRCDENHHPQEAARTSQDLFHQQPVHGNQPDQQPEEQHDEQPDYGNLEEPAGQEEQFIDVAGQATRRRS